jgi:hypothetical protein
METMTPGHPCSSHRRALCFECYRAARARRVEAPPAGAGGEPADTAATCIEPADTASTETASLRLVAPAPALTPAQIGHRTRMLAHLQSPRKGGSGY